MNPTTTPEGQTAANRIKEFRQNINNGATAKEARAIGNQIQAGPSVVTPPKRNLGTVSANQLSAPIDPVNVPQPQVATGTSPRTSALVSGTLGGIRSMSESAQGLRETNDQLNALSNNFSATALSEQFLQKFGVTEKNLNRLSELGNQMTAFETQSAKNKLNIESGGQGAMQGQRSLTQEDRELAIRSAETASQAEILRGNITLGRELARDAVNLAITDRNFKADNMIRQIKSLQGTVDEETRQLLVAEERKYTEIKERGKELSKNISDAVTSGAASEEEVRQLNALSETQRAEETSEQYFSRVRNEDATKLALAQSITARGAGEMRGLDIAGKQASIDSSRASTANSMDSIRSRRLNDELAQSERVNAGNQFGTVDGKAQSAVQAAANGYADRLVESESIISQLGTMFTGQDAFGGILPNAMQSSERQQFEQSKRNFINSVLRRESGAAIADSEFDSADLQYFPQRGDSPEVEAQKSRNRNTVINNLFREANVFRPVNSGDIIESDGIKYQVGADGQTLTKLE